jgi:hypothetical protein
MKKSYTLLLSALLLAASITQGQTTVSAFLGWDGTKLNDYALTNPVQAMDLGHTANTTFTVDGINNSFTLDFGGGSTADFTIVNTWNPSTLRQFGSALRGPTESTGTRNGTLNVTLTSVANIDPGTLVLDWISIGSLSSGDFTSTLPDGTISTAVNLGGGNLDATWEVGQSLILGHTSANVDSYNFEGFQITAVPEPSTSSLIAGGIIGLGLVFHRRLRVQIKR